MLPFQNMSADPENEYFSDGITEELINALSQVTSLRVAARSSSFAFKGKSVNVHKVGEELNVTAVLEGSVRKAGNRLRITAQLINVADGYQIWSDGYDRELEDVFAIQVEISQSIVNALRVVLSDEERNAIGKGQTAHIEAYDYYLRGRQYFHQFRQQSIQYARRMFSRAVEIDQDYASAHAGIADCSSILFMYFDASEANLAQADASSLKALELDPSLAEAHVSRGLALTVNKRYSDAEKEFETAVGLNPKLFEAYYFYARTCFGQGELEKAAELFDKACSVRPEDYQALHFLAQTYTALGRKDKASEVGKKALQLTETHLQLNPDDARALYLGAAQLADRGEREQSMDWLRRARDIDPEDAAVLYNVACGLARLGQVDESIDVLGQAVENGAGHKEWWEHDPDLDPLRGDPRFKKLMDRLV